MQLIYRGHAYNSVSPQVEAIETQNTVTFLGRRSKVKQFNVHQRQQPQAELTYRGIRYTR